MWFIQHMNSDFIIHPFSISSRQAECQLITRTICIILVRSVSQSRSTILDFSNCVQTKMYFKIILVYFLLFEMVFSTSNKQKTFLDIICMLQLRIFNQSWANLIGPATNRLFKHIFRLKIWGINLARCACFQPLTVQLHIKKLISIVKPPGRKAAI